MKIKTVPLELTSPTNAFEEVARSIEKHPELNYLGFLQLSFLEKIAELAEEQGDTYCAVAFAMIKEIAQVLADINCVDEEIICANVVLRLRGTKLKLEKKIQENKKQQTTETETT